MTEYPGDENATDRLREELKDLDKQIAELTGDDADLHAQAGGEAEGAQDSEDVATELTNAEETEGALDALRKRRESIVGELGGE